MLDGCTGTLSDILSLKPFGSGKYRLQIFTLDEALWSMKFSFILAAPVRCRTSLGESIWASPLVENGHLTLHSLCPDYWASPSVSLPSQLPHHYGLLHVSIPLFEYKHFCKEWLSESTYVSHGSQQVVRQQQQQQQQLEPKKVGYIRKFDRK